MLRSVAVALCCLGAGCGARMFLNVEAVSVDKGLRLWLGGGGNTVGVFHGRQALLSDLKLGDFALRLRREVEDELRLKVSRILLTHAHFDHAGGLKLYPGVGAVLAHPNTRKRLEADGVRAPFVDVDGEVRLYLGEEEVRVLNLGSGHTDGDLVAYLPKRKWLVAGDLVNENFEPRADEKFGGNVLLLSRTVRRMLELDFTELVPGHGQVMKRAQVEHFADYLTQAENAVRAELAKGLDEEAASRAVVLTGFDDIKESFFTSSRQGTLLAMARAVKKETAEKFGSKESGR